MVVIFTCFSCFFFPYSNSLMSITNQTVISSCSCCLLVLVVWASTWPQPMLSFSMTLTGILRLTYKLRYINCSYMYFGTRKKYPLEATFGANNQGSGNFSELYLFSWLKSHRLWMPKVKPSSSPIGPSSPYWSDEDCACVSPDHGAHSGGEDSGESRDEATPR